jgi:hypothetical protein
MLCYTYPLIFVDNYSPENDAASFWSLDTEEGEKRSLKGIVQRIIKGVNTKLK